MKKTYYLLGTLSAGCLFLFALQFHARTDSPIPTGGALASNGTENDPGERLHYEWTRLRDPATGLIPRDTRQKELAFAQNLPTREQVDGLGKTAAAQTATWVSRGPWNVGGRTRALAVDVAGSNHLLAGGASGGMWSSTNGGTSWTRKTPRTAIHSVTCIAQDTRSGHQSTWYYGTGEALGNSAANFGTQFAGDGIFKSTDNGETWSLLPATSTHSPEILVSTFGYVYNIAVNPVNGDVYAAVMAEIRRSTDNGATWSVVLGGGNEITTINMATDVRITSTGRLYATGKSGTTMAGIWVSASGAAGTWTSLTPTGGYPSTYGRIVIGIAPSNENTVYFLLGPPLGLADTNGTKHRIWKYNNALASWSTRKVPTYNGSATKGFDSQGSYDLFIAVKPDNENTVVAGGVNLFRSTTGFDSTGAAAKWIGGYVSENTATNYTGHHSDEHSFVFMPGSSIAYSGHDGGVSKTTDILANPVVWTSLNNGYATTQCYTVALDHGTSGSDLIMTGLQDNGVWQGSSPSGTANWDLVATGDGAYQAFSNGGTYRYISLQNGATYRIPASGVSPATSVEPVAPSSGYFAINPFILDPNNSNMMYMAYGENAARNPDVTVAVPSNGWTLINTASTTSATALGISKATPANRLYVGSESGELVRFDNANGTPTRANVRGSSFPLGGFISCVAVDPTNGDKALVTFSNYNVKSLWYTTNGGTSWKDVEGNLSGAEGPSCRYAVIVPYNDTTRYFIGTSTGVYSTRTLADSVTVWALEGSDSIGNVVVDFLDARTADGTVIVGTHANGVYSTSLALTTTVYSGDANNDGSCDVRDLLPIGRFFDYDGPPRTGGSLTWNAQTAIIWGTPAATYADCNGDGAIDGTDVVGLINNYGRSHSANDNPEPDKKKVCTMLLAEIDKETTPSHAMIEVRNAIVAYMENELGVTYTYALDQNYPNPFNPSTTIHFTIAHRTERAQLAIFDITGKQVWSKTLNDVTTGNHEIVWEGKTSNGATASSGVYFYRLSAGDFSATKRMLLIK